MLRLFSPFNGNGEGAAYTVFEPPGAAGSRFDRADDLVFVKDGFSWPAALLSPFYFALRGEWLGVAAYAAAAVLLVAVLNLVGAGAGWYGWLLLLLNVVAGFEASQLHQQKLARVGWREVAIVSGARREDAERRFFDGWLSSVAQKTETAEPHALSSPSTATAAPAKITGEVAARAASGFQRLAGRILQARPTKT